jgi:hypothetical protein
MQPPKPSNYTALIVRPTRVLQGSHEPYKDPKGVIRSPEAFIFLVVSHTFLNLQFFQTRRPLCSISELLPQSPLILYILQTYRCFSYF